METPASVRNQEIPPSTVFRRDAKHDLSVLFNDSQYSTTTTVELESKHTTGESTGTCDAAGGKTKKSGERKETSETDSED